jgi:phosphoenolpyruvate synthase/pyruvate phosphate dikinase
LSENAEGQMVLSATWGLGSAIAQGEVVPDLIVLTRQGFLRTNESGRKHHRDICRHGASGADDRTGVGPQATPRELVDKPCLNAGEAVTLGRMLRKAEAVFGMPIEIEWALDDYGFKLLQARPLTVAPAAVPDEIWLRHPGLNGHPAGIGWGSGRAVVVTCECELTRIAPGDAGRWACAQPGAASGCGRCGGTRRFDLPPCLTGARARHPYGARRARRDAKDS